MNPKTSPKLVPDSRTYGSNGPSPPRWVFSPTVPRYHPHPRPPPHDPRASPLRRWPYRRLRHRANQRRIDPEWPIVEVLSVLPDTLSVVIAAEALKFRVPLGVRAMLFELAARKETTVPDLLRSIVRRELEVGHDRAAELDWSALVYFGQAGRMVKSPVYRHELPPEVGDEIRRAFHRTGMTMAEAAHRIGISESYFYRLTVAERCPSRPVAWRLIDVLGLDDEVACDLLDAAVVRPK